MEENKKKEFYDLIKNYSSKDLMSVKNFFLSGAFDFQEEGLFFLKIVQKNEDIEGQAVAYFLLSTDRKIELVQALQYSNKAYDLIIKVKNFEYNINFLSILNNRLALFNVSGDIKSAVSAGRYATKIIKNFDPKDVIKINYAISVNFASLLLNLGMYNKARKVVKDVILMSEYLSNDFLFNAYFYYILASINLEDYKEASEKLEFIKNHVSRDDLYKMLVLTEFEFHILFETNKWNQLEDVFDTYNFYYTKQFNKNLQEDLTSSLLARYYIYKNKYDSAIKIINFLETKYINTIPVKSLFYYECASMYKCMNDEQKEIKYLRLAASCASKEKNELCELMEDDSIHKEALENNYKFLYDRVSKINDFEIGCDQITSVNELARHINENLIKVVDVETADFFIIDQDKSGVEYYTNDFSKHININEIDSLNLGNEILLDAEKDKKLFDLFHIFGTHRYAYIYVSHDEEENISAFLFKDNDLSKIQTERKLFIPLILKYLDNKLSNTIKFQRARHQANIDALTEIQNRNALYNRLEKINSSKTYIVSILDLDDFKYVNDHYSHVSGDEVLQYFAQKLVKYFDFNDVYRIGGDEFFVLMDGQYEDYKRAEDLLRKDLNEMPVHIKQHLYNIKFSSGIIQTDRFRYGNPYNMADSCLYNAKQNGKNRSIFYDEILNKKESSKS